MLNQIFISYRHENQEHSRAVRKLGEQLRQAGLPVMLDQLYLDEHPGGPNEGWPLWCENNLNNSTCVLIIASEGWFAAYDGTTPPRMGLGAAVEAALVRQNLYDQKGNNERFRLTFLDNIAADKVPVSLRGWHQFQLFESNDQLDQLVRWAANCLGLQYVEGPRIHWPEPLEFLPDLADRHDEWPAIVELLAGRSPQRILLYEGESGLGKSQLLRQAKLYAAKLGIPTVRVDFKGGIVNIDHILGRFDLDLSTHLPNFSRDGGNKISLLLKDLRSLDQPVLVIFDSYETIADNSTIVDWLSQQFLAEIETAPGLVIIVGGQKVPEFTYAEWRELCAHFPLQPITEIVHWEAWVKKRYPNFNCKGAHLHTVLMIAKGNPANVINSCETIERCRT